MLRQNKSVLIVDHYRPKAGIKLFRYWQSVPSLPEDASKQVHELESGQ
jgi:hypothetical protein